MGDGSVQSIMLMMMNLMILDLTRVKLKDNDDCDFVDNSCLFLTNLKMGHTLPLHGQIF